MTEKPIRAPTQRNLYVTLKSTTRRLYSINEFGVLVALLIMGVVMSLLSPYFLRPNNLINIIRQISIIGIIASGMTFAILIGGIDLSVGSAFAFSGCLMGLFMENGMNAWLAVAIGLIVGTLLGSIVGLLITRLDMPPFVATLGMMSFLRGMALTITNGWPIALHEIAAKYPVLFKLGQGKVGPIPLQALCMGIVLLILHFVLSSTSFGYKVYAVGGNERAAFLSGINVKMVKIVVFALSGFLCAFAAILGLAYISAIEPQIGMGYELDAIAAAVIGGTSLMGGVGTIFGTFLGACIMGVLYNGLVLLGVSPFLQQTFIGIVVIGAVAIGGTMNRQRLKRQEF